MSTRIAKLLLFAAIGLLYTLVVFNNLTDFDSNYQFVRHVLMMDTTFPGNRGLWRALHDPMLHLVFYWSIILWEFVTMVLCWWGLARLLAQLKRPASDFNAAKGMPILALTLGMLLWLVAFLAVGGEWFLMWQSTQWNGLQTAYRMLMIVGLVLLLMVQPERDDQP
ncbi:MAG: DUF2165 domain-containing protein [Acidobacteria bacterium]|nr:DUF2165 domain-containing protein [Acidobacteriota bacterium]